MSATRVGVVGAGVMGGLHARTIVRATERGAPARLVAVVDRHRARAERIAASLGATASDDLVAVLPTLDALVVAVPTRGHAAVAIAGLEAGLDLLIEKPLAPSVEAGRALVERARSYGRILQVGHVEWYNTAWREAAQRAGRPKRIEIERLSPPIDRGLDIDVVQDYMLHDLDWVTRWVGEDVVEIEATGRRVTSPGLDEAEALLRFRSGCTARLRASRVHSERLRRLRVDGSAGHARANLVLPVGNATEAGDGSLRSRPAEPDPLARQWAAFLDAVQSRKAPENDGRVGIAALELVERVRSAIAAGG